MCIKSLKRQVIQFYFYRLILHATQGVASAPSARLGVSPVLTVLNKTLLLLRRGAFIQLQIQPSTLLSNHTEINWNDYNYVPLDYFGIGSNYLLYMSDKILFCSGLTNTFMSDSATTNIKTSN